MAVLNRGRCYWARRTGSDAIRALAFKWIRILFRCWKNHKAYFHKLARGWFLSAHGEGLLIGALVPLMKVVG